MCWRSSPGLDLQPYELHMESCALRPRMETVLETLFRLLTTWQVGRENFIILSFSVKLSRYRNADDKGESKYSSYLFLASVLHGGEWSGSHPGRALPPGKDTRYPLGRRLDGPGADLDTEARGKIFYLCQGSNPVVQSVVRHCTDWVTPARLSLCT
jgi:hypothetical protein